MVTGMPGHNKKKAPPTVVRPRSKLCFICNKPVRGRGYASKSGVAHKKCVAN